MGILLTAAALPCAPGYGNAQEAAAPGVPAPTFGGAPTITPYDVAPRLLNRDDVRRVLVQEYPPALRRERIGGTTLMWLLVDEDGDLMSARIKASSGRLALDAAAIRVVGEMRFAPATYRGAPVRVWVAAPIIFSLPPLTAGSLTASASRDPRKPFQEGGVDMSPREPSDVPALLNGAHAMKLLKARYEAAAMTARGTARLRMLVDRSGNVVNAEIARSSGDAGLDSLALAIRPTLVYVPAVEDGRFVDATVELPVKFPPKKP